MYEVSDTGYREGRVTVWVRIAGSLDDPRRNTEVSGWKLATAMIQGVQLRVPSLDRQPRPILRSWMRHFDAGGQPGEFRRIGSHLATGCLRDRRN